MLALDLSEWIAIIGSFASIIGFALSIFQTIRYNNAKMLLHQIKRNRNAEIWTNIAMTLNAYDSIDDAREICMKNEIDDHNSRMLLSKINSSRRGVVTQYLHLLKEAVLDEEKFDEDTVEEWKRLGRLENEWRVAQARKLISTNRSNTKLFRKYQV